MQQYLWVAYTFIEHQWNFLRKRTLIELKLYNGRHFSYEIKLSKLAKLMESTIFILSTFPLIKLSRAEMFHTQPLCAHRMILNFLLNALRYFGFQNRSMHFDRNWIKMKLKLAYINARFTTKMRMTWKNRAIATESELFLAQTRTVKTNSVFHA